MAQPTEGSNEPRARGYFRDRSVVITGASSGIGEDVALGFSRQGAKVALLARRKSMLDDLAERINGTGGRAIAIECDVTKRAEVDDAIEQVVSAFKGVDILVNSAGIMLPSTIEKLKLTDLERMMSVNVYGAVNAIQAVIPVMRRARAGNIVNIASLAGRRGMSPLGGYSATKFAMVGLTEALRMEIFGSGIRVSLVMPGVIDTPMTTDAVIEEMEFGVMPSFFKMPVRWVTWAVLAAAAFGWAEVDVPPGVAIGEKIASLFPTMTDAFLSVGSQMAKVAGRLRTNSAKAEAPSEAKTPTHESRKHTHKDNHRKTST